MQEVYEKKLYLVRAKEAPKIPTDKIYIAAKSYAEAEQVIIAHYNKIVRIGEPSPLIESIKLISETVLETDRSHTEPATIDSDGELAEEEKETGSHYTEKGKRPLLDPKRFARLALNTIDSRISTLGPYKRNPYTYWPAPCNFDGNCGFQFEDPLDAKIYCVHHGPCVKSTSRIYCSAAATETCYYKQENDQTAYNICTCSKTCKYQKLKGKP